jgi:hypothetical protein
MSNQTQVSKKGVTIGSVFGGIVGIAGALFVCKNVMKNYEKIAIVKLLWSKIKK